jgi:hypothetical protein
MNRRPVTSSNVASIGWDQDVLEVEFKSGHLYEYHDVPESVYQACLGADSIGRFVRDEVSGKYQSTRVK